MLRDAESVIELDPERTDGAFEFRMSEHKLNGGDATFN